MTPIIETAQSFLASLTPPAVGEADGAGFVVIGLVAIGMVPVLFALGRWISRAIGRSSRKGAIDRRPAASPGADLEGRVRAMEQRQRDLMSFFVNFPLQIERLNRAHDLEQVCRDVAIACEAMAGAGTVLVFLLDRQNDELVLEHARAGSQELGELSGARVSPTLGVQCTVLAHQRPVWSAGMLEVQGRHFPLELATAIRVRNDTLGMIGLGDIDAPRDHTERVVACLANMAAISLENAQHLERARKLADMDRMTELYNHAYFQERLAREFSEAQSTGTDLSIFLLDVDHFKAYNDREGHPAGDALLKRLARLLNSNAGFADIVARYGGEEFVILMPGKREREALEAADAIRELVSQQDFDGADEQPGGRLTVSGGIATLRGGAPTAAELVKHADIALYRAKQLGRNRVMPFVQEFESERRRRERRRVTLIAPTETTRGASPVADVPVADVPGAGAPGADPVEDWPSDWFVTDAVETGPTRTGPTRTGPAPTAQVPFLGQQRTGPIIRPAASSAPRKSRRPRVEDEIG